MSAELFPAITEQHWREMFARVLADRRKPNSGVLAQIRAEVARKFPNGSHPSKANERCAGACENSGATFHP